MAIKASENLYGFIRGEEGFSEKAYPDAKTGKLAVGFGKQTTNPNERVDLDEADRQMRSRVGDAERELSGAVTRSDLSAGRQDVMVDMHYNLGMGGMSDFIKLVNEGDDKKISQEILRYTKAYNKETKQMEDLPALQRRVQKRRSMWDADAQQVSQGAAVDSDIMEAIAAVKQGQSQNDDDVMAAIAAVRDEESVSAQEGGPGNRREGMQLSADSANAEDALRNQEAQRLVDGMGISMEDALNRLVDKDAKTIMAENSHNTIATYFPAVAEWSGRDPNNYVMLKETGGYAQKIELAARALNNKRSDLAKAGSQGLTDLKEAAIWPQVVLGGMPIEEAKKYFREFDAQRKLDQFKDPGAEKVARSIENMDKGGDIWDVMGTMLGNPKGTALTALQAAGSSFGPTVAGVTVGGVATVTAGPLAGIIAGRGTALTTGYLVAYMGYMREQMAEFKNPETGEIDYDLALSEPARFTEWRREADIYAGIMGLSDAFYSGVMGKTLFKHASKGGAKNIIKGVAKEGAKSGLEEMASEFTATSAADLYAGRLTTKKLGKNFKKAQVEGVFGVLMGGPISTIGAGVKAIIKKKEDSAAKTLSIVKNLTEANEDLVALSNLRATVAKEDLGKENPGPIKDLIDTITQPPPIPEDPNTPVEDVTDALGASEIKKMDSEAKIDNISISPSEWDEYHRLQGKDPLETLKFASPALVQEFARSRGADSSVSFTTSEWLRITEEDPAIDVIARINGNKLNGAEANEYADGLEGNEHTLFERTVYHGSPHKFDKFRERAINTGEGAQAYGYGLYFSEDRSVAEWYRSQLTKGRNQFPQPLIDVMTKTDMFGFETTAEAIKAFATDPDWEATWDAGDLDPKEIATIKDYLVERKKPKESRGQVFEVKLPDGLWANLDDTLDSIPPDILEDIRDAVEKSMVDEKPETADWATVGTSNKRDSTLGMFIKKQYLNETYVSLGLILSSLTGQEDKNFAINIAAKGFNGITYTGVESGRRNYVVFSEDDVKVVQTFYEKNPDLPPGIPGQEEPDMDQTIEIIEADPNEPSNIAMRPVRLLVSGRTEDEKQVFKGILSRLKKALPGSDQKKLEIFAELQYRHTKNRAEMLGVSIKELDKKIRIGKATKGESSNAHGLFKYQLNVNSPYTIAFAPTADAKTVVHEFGHSWLHEMAIDYGFIAAIPEANLSDAQRAYLQGMTLMAEKSGLKNIGELIGLPDAERTRIHETFAQTTELYFLDGKFESSEMRSLLETFRTWMVEVIERIRAMTYKQYPPMKITPEIERMFDAILGASSAVEEVLIPMFPEPMFDPQMLGADGAKYLDAIKDARSEAIGRAVFKAYKQPLREREKAIDAENNRMYDEAVAEVEQMRSMIMLAGFQDAYGEHVADQSGNTPDPRLSYDSFLKVLANGDEKLADEIKAKIPRAVMRGKKKGGYPIELFMLNNGITSKAEMLNLITETGKQEQMIEELVASKIEKEFPILKSDEEIHDIAVAAVNAGGKQKLLAAEMKILMTKYPTALKNLVAKLINPPAYISNPTRETIKAEGSRLVLNASAVKFSAIKFLEDSYRHGRDASRKFKKNNIEESLESKLKEQVHFAGYKQAIIAQTGIANTRVRVKQFVRYSRAKDAANTYDADMMSYGRQVIAAVGTSSQIPNLDVSSFSQYTGVSEAHVDMVNKAIVNFYMQSQGRTGMNINVAGYLAFGDMLKTIMFAARKAKQVEVDGKIMGREVAAGKIKEEIGEGSVVDMANTTTGGNLRRSFINMSTMFESMYGSAAAFSQSTLGKVYYRVVGAESLRSIELAKFRDRISKAVRAATNDTGIVAPIINRLPIPVRWKMEDKSSRPIIYNDKFSFRNKGELHMANLLMGSESGSKKFLLGHELAAINPETMELETQGWNAFIEKQIADGVLTKKDFEMYSEIWKIFAEIHPLVEDAMRQSDGINIGEIKAKVVKNSLGEFPGGYVPVAPDRDLMAPGAADSMLDIDTMGYRIDGLYPSMNTGMTNERNKNYKGMKLNLDMSRINTYLGAALNIAYLRNPLMDFGKIVESPEVREAIERRRPGAFGTAKEGVIVRWFNAVKSQEYTEFSDDSHQRIAKHIREGVNMAMYLGNYVTVLKQGLGLLPAIARVGAVNMSSALLRTGMGASKTARATMVQKSIVMQNRISGSQEQAVRSWDKLDTNFDWVNWTEEKAKDFQWFFIQAAQNMVDTATWHAGFEHAVSKGLNEQDAINFADDSVKTSQGSPDVSSMANIQRGNDFWKVATMVSNVPIAMTNLVQAEVMRDQRSLKKATAIMTTLMLAWVMPSLIEGIIAVGLKEEDEEEADEADIAKLLALRVAMGSLDNAIPIYARPITSTVMFGAPSLSPGLSAMNNIAKAGKASKHIVNGVDLSAKEMAALTSLATVVFGKPFSIIGKGYFLEEFLQEAETIDERAAEREDQLASIEE